MKHLISPRLVQLLCLAPALAVPISGAKAQDLHPDWTRVWSHDAQPLAPGSLLVPADAVVPVTLDQPLSSLSARVGDIVTATPVSRVQGDSEFPPGTRFGGVVSQTQPASGTTPGVLDVDFQSALLPDGTEIPIHGFIASLDSGSVRDQNGHVVARDGSRVNAWKAIGVGGGVGFVLGRLLKTNTLVPTILGAAGAYLYARSNTRNGENALIGTNTTLGIRLETPVSFPDSSGYSSIRLNYLETHRTFQPELYGWNQQVCAPPRALYNDYSVVITRPIWVSVDPFDYYGCPFPTVWSERPYGYRNNGYYNGGYYNNGYYNDGYYNNGYYNHGGYYGGHDNSRDRDWNRGWGDNSHPIGGVYGPQRPVDGIFGHERPATSTGSVGSSRPVGSVGSIGSVGSSHSDGVFGAGAFPTSPSRLDPGLHRGSNSNGSPIELPAIESKQSSRSAPRSGSNFGDVFGSRSKTRVFRGESSSSSSSSGSRSKGDAFNWGGESRSSSSSGSRSKGDGFNWGGGASSSSSSRGESRSSRGESREPSNRGNGFGKFKSESRSGSSSSSGRARR